jgi:hypothetical protein
MSLASGVFRTTFVLGNMEHPTAEASHPKEVRKE